MLTTNDLKISKIIDEARIQLPNGRCLNFCNDCRMLNPPIFMIEDWAYGRLMLCWECTNRRLGRPIQLHELKDVSCNERWHWGEDPMDQMVGSLIPLILESGETLDGCLCNLTL